MSEEGAVFGNWTVVARAPAHGSTTYWTCRCVCGKEAVVSVSALRGGTSTGCKSCANRRRAKDMTGQRVGEWTVLERAPDDNPDRLCVFWVCRCVCGTLQEISGTALRQGRSQRCRPCANRRRIRCP